MNTAFQNNILTYGLTEEENAALKKHEAYTFTDASDCFTDLLAIPAAAIILNPWKLSDEESNLLAELYYVDSVSIPLFFFVCDDCDDVPDALCEFGYENGDVFDEQSMRETLGRARSYALFCQEFEGWLEVHNCPSIYHENTDTTPVKRVELHSYTQMSGAKSLANTCDMVVRAATLGHKAVAITDCNCVQACPEAYQKAQEEGVKLIYGAELLLAEGEASCATIALAKTPEGLKNLYKLISLAHLCYLGQGKALPREVLSAHRDGLLLSSGFYGSELHTAWKNGCNEGRLCEIAVFYDYLELDAACEEAAYSHVLMQLSERLRKPLVATGNVRYIFAEEASGMRLLPELRGICPAILDAYMQGCHFRTTEEWLKKLDYLGKEKAYEVVVTNTNLIADQIEEMPPFPQQRCFPTIQNADHDLVQLATAHAKELFETPLPSHVQERLDNEISSILEHGFATAYLIARKLVEKSNEDGYCVGYRGSVGASLVAYLLGITEVDPLKYKLPFEAFAGLDGAKIPDFYFNFSGDYQHRIHQYVEELFGADHVLYGGTIQTCKGIDADAVYRYCIKRDCYPHPITMSKSAAYISGVKRGTGIHPGSLLIVPAEREIYDFTPIQHPGDDPDSEILITHFAHNSLADTLLQIACLGHDAPSLIKKMEDITGIDAKSIPLDDKKTLRLILSGRTLGLAEFEGELAREIIEISKPKSFDDLVQVCGLVHGTDAWTDNAEMLLRSGQANISEVIALRDDIMLLLLGKGVERSLAFEIMHAVYMGHGLSDAHRDVMKRIGIPAWYMESCCKIRYLLPKAHAVQYILHAFRLAWFKAHYPAAFYKVCFSVYADGETDVLAMDAVEVDKRIEVSEEKMEEFEYRWIEDEYTELNELGDDWAAHAEDIKEKYITENYKTEQALQLLRIRKEMLSIETVF